MANNTQPITIGPYTVIDFPKLGIKKVPAKVDTGADSSSVWASNIREKDGRLSFTLFAPSSPLYTGEVISTKHFDIRSIKNSFGQTEFRYKVKIKVSIEGRVINVSFTLADRSATTFPVLIGRRTLHGRFLVDVSNASRKKRYNVLVFNEKKTNIKPVIKLFNQIERRSHKARFTITDYSNLKFYIDESSNVVELVDEGKDIKKFDMVYFKQSLVSRDIANAAACYLDLYKVPILNPAILQHYTNNKLKQYVKLNAKQIRVPKSIFVPQEKLAKSYYEISKFVGKPFILKSILGKKGQNNFLITDKKSFQKACDHAKAESLQMIAQQYIPNDGDYRVLVLGRQTQLVIHRQNKSGKSHLNNTSAGGVATLIDNNVIPGFIREMCVEAASIVGLDIAGVDLVQDRASGLWYCLEVNAGPQLATGAFVSEKEAALTNYFQRKLGTLV